MVIPKSYTKLQSIRCNLTGNRWDTKFISFVFHVKHAVVFELNQTCFNWIIKSHIYFHSEPLNWKILKEQKYLYVSPLINAPDVYIISKLLGMVLIRGRGIKHIEFQSCVIVFFKPGMKYKTLPSISQKNMKIPNYQ